MLDSSRCVLSLLVCLGVTHLFAGCGAPATKSRWSNHFDGAVWGGALGQQIHRPDRYIPEGVLLATIPAAFAYDDDVLEWGEKQTISSGEEFGAAALQVILPVIPVTIGIVDWKRGDKGRNLEVAVESLGSAVLVQQILANTVSRDRPDHKERTSFPSGHTSWAFAATTLIVRNLHDPADDSFHAVDALVYAPAMYSAYTRIVLGKHWPSDVASGALLGVFLTNWIWDAHYQGKEEPRASIFGDEGRRGIAWSPTVDVIDGNLAFGVRGAF